MKITRKPKGFTLIEILLAVGFISLASVVTYQVAKNVSTGWDAEAEGRNLVALSQTLIDTFGVAGIYTGVTTANVASHAEILPNGMADPTGTYLVNKWGGNILVNPAPDFTNSSGTVVHGFTVTDQQVPTKACARVVTKLSSMYDSISINNQSVKSMGQLSADPLKIAVYCAQSDSIEIELSAYRQ